MLSRDEQDRWRRIEAELAGERRLARLSLRLTAISNGAGLPTRTCVFWLVGGLIGLATVIAGTVTHTHGLIMAGVGVFIATVLISGVLLIAFGLRTGRN